MGVFSLIHTATGQSLFITTQCKDVINYLPPREARTGQYHIEIRDKRGYLCNAIYSLQRQTWILQPIK